MAEEGTERGARHIDTGEFRRDCDRVASSERPENRCVVIGEMDIGIPGSELIERRYEEQVLREEQMSFLSDSDEVVEAESRSARIVEIVAPRKLGEQAPEEAEIIGRFDLDVAVPDRLASADLFMDKPKGVGSQLHACVQQQHEIALRRRQAGPPRLEPTDTGKTEHLHRNPLDSAISAAPALPSVEPSSTNTRSTSNSLRSMAERIMADRLPPWSSQSRRIRSLK